jgi:hypothetical protein
MYIELLEQGIAKDPEREQEYFSVLNNESVRLSRLINNVLELSRLENKQRRIHLQDGEIADVFDELETIMGEKVRQAGFTWVFDNQCSRPFKFDPEILMLILINLIDNSLKFGKAEPLKTITVKSWQEGVSTILSVSDTGPGIPRKDLKKIFIDFYRVEGALTQTTRGTGIGLSLVKKFTRMMKGTKEAGPSAVFAFKKEGYKKSDISFEDLGRSLAWPGFQKIMFKFMKFGIAEYHRSFNKNAFTKALQRLIPEIRKEDLEKGDAGVRALACGRNGELLDDFVFAENEWAINVLNAPSPAATAGLSIGEIVADKALARLD